MAKITKSRFDRLFTIEEQTISKSVIRSLVGRVREVIVRRPVKLDAMPQRLASCGNCDKVLHAAPAPTVAKYHGACRTVARKKARAQKS